MSVKVAFFKLILKTLQLMIIWTITAVSTWSSLRNFWHHT